MSQIPQQEPLTPEGAFAKLQTWFAQKLELAKVKTAEVLSRKEMAAYYFPEPVKGTQRLDLGDGFDLKLVHKFNYKVDEAAVDNVTAAQIKKMKLPWEDLFVYKPELSQSTYNDLTEEQRKFVDGLLIITDATPDLDIVPRADYDGAAKHAEAAVAASGKVVPIEDPEDGKPGDYYLDDENQWWHVKDDGEWETVEDPNVEAAPAAKPKRGGRKAK